MILSEETLIRAIDPKKGKVNMINSPLISTSLPDFFLRKAQPNKKDCDLVVEYLRLLGIHQKTQMTKDPDAIRELILADKCELYFAVYQGAEIGMNCVSEITALCSGFTGFYMEAFYIEEAFRGKGFGTVIMAFLAKLTLERGHKRLQWLLMDNNESGARFYESIGSHAVPAMSTFRMNEEALKRMAAQFPGTLE